MTPIDDYLRSVPEPARGTLRRVREAILAVVPDAEETISYRVPAFRVDGAIVAGFAAAKRHCSFYPFSGGILPALAYELDGYERTRSALHFPLDRPLPKALVRRLVRARLDEARAHERARVSAPRPSRRRPRA